MTAYIGPENFEEILKIIFCEFKLEGETMHLKYRIGQHVLVTRFKLALDGTPCTIGWNSDLVFILKQKHGSLNE